MAKTVRSKAQKKLGGTKTETGHRTEKVATVDMVADRLRSSGAVLLTEYRGMKVGELKDLRAALAKHDTDYKVVKNSLATIAVRKVGLEDLVGMLQGPVAIAFVGGDVVSAAKEIQNFAKTAPALLLKGGILEGKVITETQAKGLATLESREVLLTKVAGLFQSPLQQMANLISAPLRNLGSALAQLKDKLPEQPAA